MNKRQKEIIGNRLASEKQILDELKEIYEEARNSIDDKISQLLAREDTENLQTIIYQVDQQKALRGQINAVLDDLNTKQFDSISKYLTDSYEDGFIGAMYDLQGQGIPLIFPIDHKSVIRALKHDSKIKESLYTKLGHDTEELKKRIRNEVSRGISQSYSYDQIARNINNQTNIGFNKAIRIARTESHRIANEAALDAQHKAKEAGADVVKQWDATLDKKTRSAHRILDGQIRELDESFEVNGYKAMQPGGFGRASLDINCRCSILQRAKWAIDEEEEEILKQRDEYFDIKKPNNYKEFKERYKQVVNKSVSKVDYLKGYNKLDLQNLVYTHGMRDFADISKMSESELKKVAAEWFDEMDEQTARFKTRFSNLVEGENVKEIIQKLNSIDYRELPTTLNQHSMFQRYVTIARDINSDLPTLVNNLDKVDGKFELFRAVKDNQGIKGSTINEMTKHSNYSFYGKGVFGDGIYFTTVESGAKKYGGDMIRAKLKPTAKTITFEELVEKTEGLTDEDRSIWAVMNGYDAIIREVNLAAKGEKYISVLSRSALWIEK